ncbi:hypothetical protein P5W99_37635 [Paraburkholderia sp. A3BS-1L]|uniref:hypothetical protein n=1 Tax=Paraburkholderia sp. A3BS-1L TaxID=3028375 RepID=UPI003DA8DD2A
MADIYDHDRASGDALRTLAGNNFNYRQFGSLTVKEAIKVVSAIRQINAAPCRCCAVIRTSATRCWET